MNSPSLRPKLVELLVDMFSAEELHQFVRISYPALASSLPTGSTLDALALALVEVLDRHGLLDQRFLDRVHEQRPGRSRELEQVRHLLCTAEDDPAAANPLDRPISELKARIASLEQDGLDASNERTELLELRRKRRDHPSPGRGLVLAGRYNLETELGRGGFATVWRAYDRQEQRFVAVKRLHAHCAEDPIRRERFIRGMRTLQSFDHPNILRVHAPEVLADGHLFAVLELVAGGDLQQAFVHHRLTRDQLWPILLAVCDALAVVHDRGLVHRDIKPSNILIAESGAPLLTDFDLVLAHDTTGGTRTGALGTVFYCAPELWNDARSATPAADVYALAMTALFALRGTAHTPEVFRDMDGALDEVALSPVLRAVLARALAWEPEQRFPHARALAAALKAALERQPPARSDDPFAEQDILYWIADERGRAETVWISETNGRPAILARAPGIVLIAGSRIWRLARETRTVIGVEGRYDEDTNEDLGNIIAHEIDAADLVEVGGVLRVPLGICVDPSQPDIPVGQQVDLIDAPGPEDLGHTVDITFSAGFYALIRSSRYYCYSMAAHGGYDASFAVLDLRTGEECDLLTAEERAEIIRDLSATAVFQLDREHDAESDPMDVAGPPIPEPLEMTMHHAHYDIDGKLQLSHQFTRETYYANSDNQWHDYTCSTRVPAPRLPASLQAMAVAPRLLQQFWQTAPHHAGSHGWTAAARTPELRQRLRRCFDDLNRGIPVTE